MKHVSVYEAIIVLGLNIRRHKGGYVPTTYESYDKYGMLAGDMNVIAALCLFDLGRTNIFVFSTGTSAKTKAMFGEDAPTEAAVYSQDFLRRLHAERPPHPPSATSADPQIILEDRSVNTYSNLTEVFALIKEQGWNKVAIMSARYHLPRVKVLSGFILDTYPLDTRIDFIVSEDIIMAAKPGEYDARIAAAYASEQGKKRLKNEAQGIRDMQDGSYVIGEFQLSDRHK